MVDFPIHTFKRIAFIRRNGFGDLLCAYPTILYLKENAPNAELTLFVDARNSPLLSYLPAVDNVVIFSEKGNKYFSLLKAAFSYRFYKFDLAISSKTSPMKLMNIFLFCLGAKKRIAYCDERWHSKLVNCGIAYDPKVAATKHQAVKTLQLIAPHLTAIPSRFLPKITIPQRVEEHYSRRTKKIFSPFSEKKINLLLSATTTNPLSALNEKKYAYLVNTFGSFLPLHVIIVGEEKDKQRAFAIASAVKLTKQVYFPRTFDEFMVFLNQSDLIFVGDGGTAHLGAALGKKVVAVFGSVSPTVWAPLGERVETLFHPTHVDCIEDEKILMKLKKACQK